jgi:hypothetical protein
MERVSVEELTPEAWRWVYLDGNGSRAFSNDAFPDRSAAERSARGSYPDLEVVGPEPSHPTESRDTRPILRIVFLALLAALAILIGWSAADRHPRRS